MLERYVPEQHPLPRNPNGWFAIGLSHELLAGGVKAVSCLGRDLVVFRTMAGAVGVLDAYCPHLGTHLGLGGCVEGEVLRCPFHRWAFDIGGRCVDAPSASRVPPRAPARHWPTVERNGAILAWFHADGEAPAWQMPELERETWSPTSWLEMDYTMHIQEFAENGIDLAHFPVVHGSARASTDLLDAKNLPFHFILKTAYPGDGIGLPGQYVNVTTEWRYYGLGIFLGVSTAEDFGAQIRQLFHFTPVPGDRIILRIAFNANGSTIPEDMIEQVQEKNRELTIRNFEEDRIIWQYKRYLTRPMLSEADGPFGALRRWTRQFYPSPRAEQLVAADMEQLPEQESQPGPEVVPAPAPEGASAPVVAAGPASARAIHDTFFERLPAAFDARAAAGLEFVIQYDLSGDLGGSYFVEVRNGICMPGMGAHAAPTVRVSVDAEDWLKINSGVLNRTKAYLSGRLKVKGDMALAVKLGEIFRN